MRITGDITIEELIAQYPASVRFLLQKGIRCLECGEPIWGTLADAARERGYDEAGIERLVRELNEWLSEEPIAGQPRKR
jgi:hybrid cluster-associated redox disulfide protein